MNQFSALPTVVKNLLIINIILLLITVTLPYFVALPGPNLYQVLSLHYFQSELFKPHQFVTYMFMHAGIFHVFTNMIAVFMFGSILEQVWGSKRFLTFYMICGLGSGMLHMAVQHYEIMKVQEAMNVFLAAPDPDGFLILLKENYSSMMEELVSRKPRIEKFAIYKQFADKWSADEVNALAYAKDAVREVNALYQEKVNGSMVGASGAVFGILIATAMMLPEMEVRMFFLPIPIKMKFFAFLYAALELYAGVSNHPNDNVAHYAHLGGALFGFILVKIWSREKSHFN